jgi:ribosome-associated protein
MARLPWYDDDDDDDDSEAGLEDGVDAEKSKSQIKRELLALDPLTEELMGMPDRQLAALGLSEGLMAALRTARGLKRGALKRQLRYARGLLAEEDHAGVAAAVAALKQPRREQIDAMHQLEDWRERLIAGDQALLDDLFRRYPDVDRQQLLQLVRNAKAEREAQKPPRAARALFKLLSAMRGAAAAS